MVHDAFVAAVRARELDDALVASKSALETTEAKRASLQKVADERTGAESAVGEKTNATSAAIEKALGQKRQTDQISLATKNGRVIVGLDPSRRRAGLGLRGIEERVKELGGTMTIRGEAGKGTAIAIQLPMPSGSEVPLARAAG